MPSILILEDDITFSLMLKTWLGRKGFEVSSVSSVSDAKNRIEDVSFDLILSDLRLPDGDGIDLLKWIKENNISIPLIMMTSYAEIQTAVQAIKLGASDYIAKPLNPEELLGKIRDVIKTGGEELVAPAAEPAIRPAKRPESSGGNNSQYIEGQSQAARQLYEHVRLVAPTDMSVLITGSSGKRICRPPYPRTEQPEESPFHRRRLRSYPERLGSLRIFRSCERLVYRSYR